MALPTAAHAGALHLPGLEVGARARAAVSAGGASHALAALEGCNGKDDDCDGTTDESAVCSDAYVPITPGTSRFLNTRRLPCGTTST